MRELDFAYVGLGVHEEVVYSVAEELGYYADEGLRVSIRDGVRWDDERLRQAAVVGLGRTLLIRLLAGTPWTMLCVNTERALFWLMARAEFSDVSGAARPQGGDAPRARGAGLLRAHHPPRPRARP